MKTCLRPWPCLRMWIGQNKEIEWFTEDQAFSPSNDMAPPPTQPMHSPLPSISSTRTETHWETDKKTTCWRERGGREWGRSQIIRQRESQVLYINHSILSENNPLLSLGPFFAASNSWIPPWEVICGKIHLRPLFTWGSKKHSPSTGTPSYQRCQLFSR